MPLPEDDLDTAVDRLRDYLADRFDIHVGTQPVRERMLAAPTDGIAPPRAGLAAHPYLPGMLSVESAYDDAAYAVLMRRTVLSALIVMLLGSLAIRCQFAVLRSKPGRIVALCLIPFGLLAWFLTPGGPLGWYEAFVSLDRLFAEVVWIATPVVVVVAGALVVSAARALAPHAPEPTT